jgi:hypothetical protein
MEHIRTHLPKGDDRNDRKTERGEMMEYFIKKLNVARKDDGLSPITMPRMGRILQGIPTKDLYYLKSVCEDAPNFSKKFWFETKPRK